MKSGRHQRHRAHGVRIVVVASPYLDTPHFEVRRLRDDEVDQSRKLSFDIDLPSPSEPAVDAANEPGVGARGISPWHARSPAPEVSPKEKPAIKPAAISCQRQRHKTGAGSPVFWRLGHLFGDDTQDKAKQRQGGRGGKEQNRRRSLPIRRSTA